MTKQLSTHAATAKAIRQELKQSFPTTIFRVTARSFSMGNSVDIRWENGPTHKQVNEIVGKYQYGHFDGMQDIYEHSNVRKDISQVKYVQTSRELTKDTLNQVFAWLQQTRAHFDNVTDIDEGSNLLFDHWKAWTAREYIQRILNKVDLSLGFNPQNVQ